MDANKEQRVKEVLAMLQQRRGQGQMGQPNNMAPQPMPPPQGMQPWQQFAAMQQGMPPQGMPPQPPQGMGAIAAAANPPSMFGLPPVGGKLPQGAPLPPQLSGTQMTQPYQNYMGGLNAKV